MKAFGKILGLVLLGLLLIIVALGFALWENISYVMIYGFSTALVRAVTAVPGHACFGVFMGIFYGLARGYAYLGKNIRSKFFRVLAIVVPAALHGSYDYVASLNSAEGQWIFLAFIAVLPNMIAAATHIQGVYFGGTALLIVVGVALQTMKQIEAMVVMRHYEGFMK